MKNDNVLGLSVSAYRFNVEEWRWLLDKLNKSLSLNEAEAEIQRWLSERQRRYDERIVGKGIGISIDPTSRAALDIHDQIVREIDKLPVEQGGKS